jgi:hypothetical protein
MVLPLPWTERSERCAGGTPGFEPHRPQKRLANLRTDLLQIEFETGANSVDVMVLTDVFPDSIGDGLSLGITLADAVAGLEANYGYCSIA